MSDFKEFLGKTLDAAIAEACSYYDAPREKLEIEIIEDAKSGIFGIVCARKARIQARRAQLPDVLGRSFRDRRDKHAASSLLPTEAEKAPVEKKADLSAPETARSDNARPETPRKETSDVQPSAPRHEQDAETPEQEERQKKRSRRSSKNVEAEKPAPAPVETSEAESAADAEQDMPPRVALTELDQEKLVQVSTDIIRSLVESIAEEPSIEIQVTPDRLQVRVDSADTGLLIGRDGQNLAAVQYLATRMIARAMDAQIRLQLDAGDYHSRQDTRLRELALSLAEKVKQTGHSQSTRPLSAYQRRLIHLCLQDDPEVQTRSSGEGAMKRVIILRRKDAKEQPAAAPAVEE